MDEQMDRWTDHWMDRPTEIPTDRPPKDTQTAPARPCARTRITPLQLWQSGLQRDRKHEANDHKKNLSLSGRCLVYRSDGRGGLHLDALRLILV